MEQCQLSSSLHHSFAARPCMITRVKITTFSWNLRKIWLLLFLRKIEIINLHINFDYTGIFLPRATFAICSSVWLGSGKFSFQVPSCFFRYRGRKNVSYFVGWTLRNSSQLFSPKLFVNLKEMKPFVLHQFPTRKFYKVLLANHKLVKPNCPLIKYFCKLHLY